MERIATFSTLKKKEKTKQYGVWVAPQKRLQKG